MHFFQKNHPWKPKESLKKIEPLKTILCLFFIGFFSTGSLAQSKIDSLQNILENTHGKERAELLLELSSHTRQKNIEKAISQAKEALVIAKRVDEVEIQSKSLQKLGFFYYSSDSDRDTLALEYLLKALKIERQHWHRIGEANVLHKLGRFYMDQNNHPKALDYFFQALRIRQDL